MLIFAKGSKIFKAATEGAKRGYNRSTDNYGVYVDMLEGCYREMLSEYTEKDRLVIIRNTNDSWREAMLPLCLAKLHHHKKFAKCETHARVYLLTDPSHLFDIPLSHWQRLLACNSLTLAKRAA